MTDDDLQRRVAAELSFDPEVDSGAIDVWADGGTVTLRGTVASLRQKWAGGRAAARVRGVTRVGNELHVRLPDPDWRNDEDLRGDVREALMLDCSVPTTVDAQARDGFVILTGTAEWHYQRTAAESRTASVPGVAGIDNAIALAQAPDARDASDAIGGAFGRDAILDADRLSVESFPDGLVILSGTVRSWAARDHAMAAAWSAPGVTEVEDRIRVEDAPQAPSAAGEPMLRPCPALWTGRRLPLPHQVAQRRSRRARSRNPAPVPGTTLAAACRFAAPEPTAVIRGR
jgi:osmotically-inducible protein OsmY